MTKTRSFPNRHRPNLSPISESAFPTEVYERIIDFIPRRVFRGQDPWGSPALASCCLTSKSWFPRSRFLLYSEVILYSRPRFEKFVHSLEINPGNASFVVALTISPNQDMGWVSAFPLALGPKLPNLSILELEDLDVTSLHTSFYQHLSFFPTVSELELYVGNDGGLWLMRILWSFPRLRKLWQFAEENSHDREDGGLAVALALARRKKFPPLRHLSVDGTNASHALLHALTASATPLITLDFALPLSETAGLTLLPLGSFLLSCDTLRTLRLDLDGLSARAACSHLSFSALPNLRLLLLDIDIDITEDISAISGLLSSVSARSLQFLQLELIVGEEDILNTSASWEVLNESLSRPNIHSVGEIAVSIQLESRTSTPASEETVFGVLPALKNMNVVARLPSEDFYEYWEEL